MENSNEKIQYITAQALENQTQVILSALDERFVRMETNFDNRFDRLVKYAGDTKSELSKEIMGAKEEIK